MNKSEKDTGWIIGLIESKGVFTKNSIKIVRKTAKGEKIYAYSNPAFYLVSKDKSALEIARGLLGIGSVRKHGAIFHLEVRRKSEVVRLVELLEGKLRSEFKIQQYKRWREKVLQWKSRGRT